MTKQYSQAPLPFVGQKRMFATEFRRVLKQFGNATTFVDLFGGSGLLSHIAKHEHPHATVVYNDYDNYRQRLENIPRTNTLLAGLRLIVEGCPRAKPLPELVKEAVLKHIAHEELTGFVDYITLSTSLLFSMKYATGYDALSRETLYSRIRTTDYSADGYLNGLTVECCDYRELFLKYRNLPNVVFLADPPYLNTCIDTYRMNWHLHDYLDVLKVLCGTSFVYFTSNKSSIIELCEWIEQNKTVGNPFAGAQKRVFNAQMNYSSSYLDMMWYKKEAAA